MSRKIGFQESLYIRRFWAWKMRQHVHHSLIFVSTSDCRFCLHKGSVSHPWKQYKTGRTIHAIFCSSDLLHCHAARASILSVALSFVWNLPLLQKTGNLDPKTIIDRRKEAWAETQAFCLKLWGFMYLCRLLERMGNLEQFVFLKGPGNDLKADGKPNVAIACRHSDSWIANDANWIAIPNKC